MYISSFLYVLFIYLLFLLCFCWVFLIFFTPCLRILGYFYNIFLLWYLVCTCFFFFGFFLFSPLSVHFLLDVLYLLFYTLSLFTRSSSLFLSIIFFVLFYSTSTSPFTIFLHFFFLRNFCFFLPIHLLVISLFAPLFTRFFSVSRFECWSNQHWATLELIKVKK